MSESYSIVEKIKQNKYSPYVLIFSILSMCFLKIFFCSTLIDGITQKHCIICDYWNFTKSMLSGSELYVDLVDHKGLYLYLVYAPFVMISKNSMWGVILGETLIFSGTIAAFYFMTNAKFGKVASLFFTNLFALSYLVMSFTRPALLNTDTMLVPFYFLAYRYVLSNKKYSNKSFFLVGLMLGFFINIKYSTILYFASLFLFSTFLHFYNKNTIKDYVFLVLNGMMGVVTINIPFLIFLLKTNTFQKFVHYNALASSTELSKIIVCSFLFLINFLASICLYCKKNKYFEIFLCLSTLMVSYIGMFFNENYMVVMMLIVAPCCFNKNVKAIFSYVSLSALLCISIVTFEPDIDAKSISQTYGINNSNVLYICEDLGFGSYNKEAFIEPYQWIPFRFLYNKKFSNEIVELSKERILEKKFKFVVTSKFEGKDKLDKLDGITKVLIPYLQNNYHPVEFNTQNDRDYDIVLWIANYD